MGSVFLAHDTTLDRLVALKLVTTAGDPAMSRAQLLREGRSVAALNHPNICTIHEVGDAGGAAFIAMEYVEGRSLRERIDEGVVSLAEALRYGIDMADAISYAHNRGIVHRDLKAANVIITTAGRPKIVDFGLARRSAALVSDAVATESAEPLARAGTPYAMAPEQLRGAAEDPRTDIWALGVLLHEMVSQAKPFDGPTLAELFSSILRDEPAPLPDSVPTALRAVIRRCLAKDPNDRYQDGGEMRAALEAIATGGIALPRPRAWRGLLSLVVVAAALTLFANLVRTSWSAGTGAAPVRLAVLPFRNLSGDPAQDIFNDGLTEELISQLGQLRSDRLHVISSRSSGRYRDPDVPLQRIAGDLGVNYVLEGKTRREGTRVHVTASLIRVSDEAQQWSNSYDREVSGLIALQSDLARGVTTALSVVLLPDDERRLARPEPVDPTAYEAYINGLGHASRFTGADLDTALEYFDRALARAPDFALAHLGVATVWGARQQMHFTTPAEAAPKVRAANEAARRINPELPEVHFHLATQYSWTDWNWAAAEAEFKHAIAARPDYAEARAFYAHFLHIMHRPTQALEQIERAIRADPMNDKIQSLYGVVLMQLGRYPEAEVQFRSALKTAARSNIPLNGLARTLERLGRLDEALEAEKAVWAARSDTQMVSALDRGARAGRYSAALHEAAETLAARSRADGSAPLSLALLYVRSGDTENAMQWVERAVAARDPNAPYINIAVQWDPLRRDPRFRAVVRSMNLPE